MVVVVADNTEPGLFISAESVIYLHHESTNKFSFLSLEKMYSLSIRRMNNIFGESVQKCRKFECSLGPLVPQLIRHGGKPIRVPLSVTKLGLGFKFSYKK